MAATSSSEQSIFLAALELQDPAERAAYLNKVCGDNAALLAEVQALLNAHEGGDDFLEHPQLAGETTPFVPLAEGPGTRIGPYKLLQQIGEGGMGVVYMAEQETPVRRRVALKIIKPGMDSYQVIARFEAERQALALMDHHHIARVFDAGTTETSRPYFVMELVHGVPITKYCDDNHLSPRERLELFVPVCQAVQHAHQKGIIHRDLKPSNVLVCLYDGKPVPKVIDFGVAKAVEQRLTEKTMFTQFGTVIGTLEYMSPEQAEMSQLGVDTRSDVYSLGVLLYELLTGSTPLERQRLRLAALDEVLRLIREEEPPRPSMRLSGSGKLPAIAAARKTEPAKLAKLVRGELDWIVMKALEKDRGRRYETANGFARDVQRYLADEPVEACPPSAGYRLRKVVRKYRKPLATAATFLVLVLLGGTVTTWQAVRLAHAERAQAQHAMEQAREQAQRVQIVHDALARAQALREQARESSSSDLRIWAEARVMAKRAEALLEGGTATEELAGRVRTMLRELDEEEKDRLMVASLEAIRLRQSESWEGSGFDKKAAAPEYAAAFQQYGLNVTALSMEEAAGQVRRSAIREELLAALDNWAWLNPTKDPRRAVLRGVADRADDNTWRRALREAVARKDTAQLKALAEDSASLAQPPAVLVQLGRALKITAGLDEEAATLLRQAQQRHPADFWINHQLAWTLNGVRPSRAAEAIGYFRAALALRPDSPVVLNNLGIALRHQGDRPGAIACYHQAIELDPKYAPPHVNLGVDLADQRDWPGAIACYRKALKLDPKNAIAHSNLGRALSAQEDLPGAIACYRQAIDLDPKFALAHNNLGNALRNQGDLPGAIACFRQAIKLDPKSAGTHYNLGNALQAQGDLPGAIAYFRKEIELDPKDAQVHISLGALLNDHLKDHVGAAVCFRKAIELDPKSASAHYNLGNALHAQGDLPGASAAYRKAIELDPKMAQAHCNMGKVLRKQGEFAASLTAYQTGHELGSQRKDWRYPSEQWVKQAKRLVELEAQLPDVLSGQRKLVDAAESRVFADICRFKKFYAAAARFYTEAFTADAKLADDLKASHRYDAACFAALAAAGQGNDADQLDEMERARLRRQALEWLRADLALWTKQLESGKSQDRDQVQKTLRHWQRDPDVAGVRDADALVKLPVEERAAWQQLWADVAELLKKTEAK